MTPNPDAVDANVAVSYNRADKLALVSLWLMLIPFVTGGPMFVYATWFARGWDALGWFFLSILVFPLSFIISLVTGSVALFNAQVRRVHAIVCVSISSVIFVVGLVLVGMLMLK